MDTKQIDPKGMLVTLKLKYWRPAVRDRKVATEVAMTKHANIDAGRYSRFIFDPADFLPVTRALWDIKQIHKHRTLPWEDKTKENKNARILPYKGFLSYQGEINNAINVLNSTVEDVVIANYDELVKNAEPFLGSMYNQDDYPKVEEVRGKYSCVVDYKPLPVDDITEKVQAQMKLAMCDVWARLQAIVARTAEKLHSGRLGAKSAQALIDSINDTLSLVPELNLTEDPDVDQFVQKIRGDLTFFSAKQLASDEASRLTVADKADDILSQMAQFAA
jgi:hypothetical protein